MLSKIKLSMRIFHNAIDDDINANIAACMQDLQRVGVSASAANATAEDALIVKAAELFCKWQYDFNGKGDQHHKAYENLRDALSLCEQYTEEHADV